MHILALRLKDGTVELMEAPAPVLSPGTVRVQSCHSAVSPGTEGGKVVAGQKSLLGKAKARPDQVRQVYELARAAGLQAALQKVRAKLEGAQPLGYSLSGIVTEIGEGVEHLHHGDLVACASGYACHADENVVPVNLVVPVPEGVTPDAAALSTLGAIALQGVRLAAPTLGENAVVVGLGVIGLLAGQLLKAAGCRVFGTDISSAAVAFALQTGSIDAGGVGGAEPVESMIEEFARGRGADMVLICAATESAEPVQFAGRVSRKRGRVVVVGAVGLNVPREDYYHKELPLVVSCSYGPGRYDPTYEEGGLDYPYPYVRWTEQRNIEAFLDMAAAGRVDPLALVTHRFPFMQAPQAYRLIADRSESFAGILLDYPAREAAPDRGRSPAVILAKPGQRTAGGLGVGFIGSGSYAQSFLLPPLRATGKVSFTSIFTRSGLTAADTGKRFGFARAVGSLAEVIEDPATQAVFVATRHDQHAQAVMAALKAGKHVFVEKPLCLTESELEEITDLVRTLGSEGKLPILQVGYNRRFSPAARLARKHLGGDPGPLTMIYRVSAGVIPRDHWIHDPRQGGGRIVGEVCHFVDLMQYLCGADPEVAGAVCVGGEPTASPHEDDVLITLKFADGSIGTIGYFAHAAKSVPKERIEASAAGRSVVIDNFSRLELYSARLRRRAKTTGKGQVEEIRAFLDSVQEGRPCIAMESLLVTSRTTFEINRILGAGGRRPASCDAPLP